MDKNFERGGAYPRLLDLIPNERDWTVKDAGGGNGFGVAEERKLELRLGPPGENWPEVTMKKEGYSIESVTSLGHFSKVSKPCSGAKRGFFVSVDSETEVFHQQPTGFLQLQTKAELGKEFAQKTNGRTEQHQRLERKACCTLPSHASAASGNATVAQNSSQTRIPSAPVVGWPPIRSFRKNLTNTTSKPALESPNGSMEMAAKLETNRNGLFVKINMEGIPIGRKVDLKAYDSYEKLSFAVDELFRGLLAAQRDPAAAGNQKHLEKEQLITGLLDGSGEYTLVYEDDEGDRMLVGDVPWDMFVCTAKRLRVLKSSELSALSLGTINRKRTAREC